MSGAKLHRWLGIILVLPLLAWALTGAVFILKPGYEGAYDRPQLKTYPLPIALTISPQADWLEARALRTVLGEHLLVKTADGWQHLDMQGQPNPVPNRAALIRLVQDAVESNPQRYGEVGDVNFATAPVLALTTSTGITLTLDWNSFQLSQRGADTGVINLLYKIHYLQWFGVKTLNIVWALVTLTLLLLATWLGVQLFTQRR